MTVPQKRKIRERKIGFWLPALACLLLIGTVWLGFKTTEVQRQDNLLIAALQPPNPVLLRAALDQGADPDSLLTPTAPPGRYGMAPQWVDLLLHPHKGVPVLTDAVSLGNLQCVQLLLSRGASPNEQDDRGETPLMWAALSENQNEIPIMQMLLDKGADVNATNSAGNTALGNSVDQIGYNGSVDLTTPRFLLTHGAKADVPGRNFPDSTLLLWCVRFGNKNTVPFINLLLDHGADPNQIDGTGWTVLQRAFQLITPAIVKSLLDHGANPNISKIDDTPLMEAVRQDQISTVQSLLAKGASVNVSGSDGAVLSIAVGQKRPDLVKLLLDHGADPNYVNTFEMQQPVLVTAASVGDAASVKLLLAHAANAKTADPRGETPLTAAADGCLLASYAKRHHNTEDPGDLPGLLPVSPPCSTRVTQLLLAAGADPNKTNQTGNTALVYAVAGHNVPLVRLLMAHGADPSITGGNPHMPGSVQESPMSFATERGYSDLLPLLRQFSHTPQNPQSAQ